MTEKNSSTNVKIDNLHVVLWILKDLSWCFGWVYVGLSMILPAVLVAIYILLYHSVTPEKFIHNVSIIFWISANSIWMASEFLGFENQIGGFPIGGKIIAGSLFVAGLALVSGYYLVRSRK